MFTKAVPGEVTKATLNEENQFHRACFINEERAHQLHRWCRRTW